MIRGTSRSPSPIIGVTTRRTMQNGRPVSLGIQSNDNRERSGSLPAVIRTGSSELSAKSTERSPSADFGGGCPQSTSSSPLPLPMNPSRSKEVACSACPDTIRVQPHLQLRETQQSNENRGTVDEVVYSSANSLTAVHCDEDYTFFGDVPRTTIVVKWMRYYHYHPRTDKATDKIRRDKLKAHLKIPSGSGQKLGQFIINKFNNFRKWGYLYWDGGDQVVYCPSTDVWLSPTWDGHIERQQISIPRVTQSPNSPGGARKRQASTRISQREKRQKSTSQRSTTPPLTTKPTPSNESEVLDTLSSPRPGQHPFMMNERPSCGPYGFRSGNDPSFHDNQNKSQDRTEMNHFGSNQKWTGSCGEINLPVGGSANHPSAAAAAPNIGTTAMEGASEGANITQLSGLSNGGVIVVDKFGNHPLLHGRDLAPNPEELSARLEAINPQSISGVKNGSSSSDQISGSAKHMGALGRLRAEEKSCLQSLRESVKELDSTREKHNKLCQQFERLKDEFRDIVQFVEHKSRRQKEVAPPTPLGAVESIFAERLQDVLQNRMKKENFLRAKQEEKSSLETRIAETAEAKSNLKSGIAAKKIELKQLQRGIKKALKSNAELDVFAGEFRILLDNCKDPGGCSTSGTASPVESVPESVSSQIDGVDLLSEADGLSD
ncbi:hypothetical protein F5882DRAFT_385451 [Hyaloscypha sp. PMI_1271]|nr:hypothetical protein F5882DRAFT_385451 [Hyaloscypha sp. PMI_1271]